ncbi:MULTISPECIES: flavin reductase family protein [unclassified Streptomyces]|uniref:flavin reductase family protein n=1 Tax=unclassified Streptomyces TaxID=2593676 RepID=UPI002E77E426|nr:flavin reductase family protein [Streptomyces sp. JV176]MEE1798997.1 flavin reductase family protein [Streptomyces sp. JV176]
MIAHDTPSAATLAPGAFRELMSAYPTGVTVVTAFDAANRPWGMTCSSLCSVTLDPPTLLVCLRNGSPTLAAVLEAERFSVNLLGDSGRPVAELFASGAADRFDRVRWEGAPGRGGPHLPEDAHAVADCRLAKADTVGDHTVVFGRVEWSAIWSPAPRPLMYGLRDYAVWPAA